MRKNINNEFIRSLDPCYDPLQAGIPDNESLPVQHWVKKYRDRIRKKEDILWLLCRNEFMSNKDLRLFAVWCAREALKLVRNPDSLSINAINTAERYALGKATKQELATARDQAWLAINNIGYNVTRDIAREAALSSIYVITRYDPSVNLVERVRDAQINQLLTYFV